MGHSPPHAVAGYARLLGCSEKSLGRAVQQIAGITAKQFLSQRIALEANRLLVHTAL
jgi:AraC-like DNA-binding protein